MSRHHPSEKRTIFSLRLSPSERLLIERAYRARYAGATSRPRRHTIGEFVREAACSIAHQVLAATSPATDVRQVELEDLIAARGERGGPLRWKSKPQGVAHAESPVMAAEYVVKPRRRRGEAITWLLELHHQVKGAGRPTRIELLQLFAQKHTAMAAAESAVRVALRTRGAA